MAHSKPRVPPPSPEEFSASSASAAVPAPTVDAYAKAITEIDRVRRIIAQKIGNDRPIQLPEITVIGGQSTGKSSLLQAMSKVPFPRDTTFCTKCPASVEIRPREDGGTVDQFIVNDGTPMEDLDQAEKAIHDAQESIGNGGGLPVSPKPISIQAMLAGGAERVTVVDNPGLRDNDEGKGILPGTAEAIRSMIESRAANPRAVMLVTEKAGNDLATSLGIRVTREYDPMSQRTLRVATMCDMVLHGDHKDSLVTEIVEADALIREDPSALVPHFVAVVGKDKKICDGHSEVIGICSGLGLDPSRFGSSPVLGVKALMRRLQPILVDIVHQNSGAMTSDIKREIAEQQAILDVLGAKQMDKTQVIELVRESLLRATSRFPTTWHPHLQRLRQQVHDLRLQCECNDDAFERLVHCHMGVGAIPPRVVALVIEESLKELGEKWESAALRMFDSFIQPLTTSLLLQAVTTQSPASAGGTDEADAAEAAGPAPGAKDAAGEKASHGMFLSDVVSSDLSMRLRLEVTLQATDIAKRLRAKIKEEGKRHRQFHTINAHDLDSIGLDDDDIQSKAIQLTAMLEADIEAKSLTPEKLAVALAIVERQRLPHTMEEQIKTWAMEHFAKCAKAQERVFQDHMSALLVEDLTSEVKAFVGSILQSEHIRELAVEDIIVRRKRTEALSRKDTFEECLERLASANIFGVDILGGVEPTDIDDAASKAAAASLSAAAASSAGPTPAGRLSAHMTVESSIDSVFKHIERKLKSIGFVTLRDVGDAIKELKVPFGDRKAVQAKVVGRVSTAYDMAVDGSGWCLHKPKPQRKGETAVKVINDLSASRFMPSKQVDSDE